jgi:Holliday junction resolvasome RuvABC ATP-dependent DNA helicase subunit
MEWALTTLFVVAALLFIFSYFKNKQASKAEQREIDTIYMSMMEEVNKLQGQIRFLELENEIISQKTGISSEERMVLRELLDLYKRNYTIEGIAGKLKLDQSEVKSLLEPYIQTKNEGRKVANES